MTLAVIVELVVIALALVILVDAIAEWSRDRRIERRTYRWLPEVVLTPRKLGSYPQAHIDNVVPTPAWWTRAEQEGWL